MVEDARYRQKVWIETYYTPANAVDDNDHALGVQAMYENPNYRMSMELKAPSVVDVIVTVGHPNSSAIIDSDRTIFAYEEHVPIGIYAVDKDGVTAIKAIWQVEAELRRIAETYPEGSQRDFQNRRGADLVLGSTTVYGSEWILSYKRLKS